MPAPSKKPKIIKKDYHSSPWENKKNVKEAPKRQKYPVYFTSKKKHKGACDKQKDTKRRINMGAGVEQRPWTPTVRKGKIAAETSSPGPACVQLPSLVGVKVIESKKPGSPAFTFGRKYQKKYETIGPGPAQYNIHGLAAKGKDSTPAASLQSRHKELTRFQTPAPGQYNVDRASKAIVDSTPKFTFGHKINLDKETISPGPNVYRIPTVLGSSKEGPIRSAPAFSVVGRVKPRIEPVPLPGPGSYDALYLAMRRKPPMYSMGAKLIYPNDDHKKPGPGAHCPELYVASKSAPASTFAIRHSRYIGNPKFHLIPDCTRGSLPKVDWCL